MILNTVFWALVLLISGILMAKSAQILIKSLTIISRFFHLSEFAISFLLMATATSLPELMIGINAALANESVLVLGNVIGSNIIDLSLVIGISIIIARNLRVRSTIAKRDSLYMLVLGSFPLVLLADGYLGRLEGFALVCFYILYISRLLKQKAEFKSLENGISKKNVITNFILFGIGIAILLGCSKLLLVSSERIALNLNLSLTFVGLILVAMGTSMPELIFETQAVLKSRSELVLGDIMGSVITNINLVLGIAAIINPIQIQNPSIFYSSAIFMVVILILFNIFLRSERKLDTVEGIILILVYISFLILELTIGFINH
ncbi:hypothetical protein A2X44_02320 [candidate division CPR3 bacterium GWF2_35_18]|nr:MAG: hypothetical protein A2X44_02320 [candidate division CPR3 bacterium GWF2_35_18]OGB65411.1 MAG: hypothetical protein A2250_00535 [candidate division CPR3 bacterium RIFOXYA2_FULL_35_13]OGB79523.1 MAG: hypothetical protein A2296_00320 [candidate division CPR3 bacterium RIFOXYB2_FULL_35_8]OGB80430.1 MAG: hypothetical protein A2011_02415 [candidate division CPR3 bacterium GWE2_35_7]